ncbi:hypothetical protein NQZ68_027199 [Dissostichus eleginoides]|nr:hypothetical protein NQZ68_027199 [Dissostichus eleginoides]
MKRERGRIDAWVGYGGPGRGSDRENDSEEDGKDAECLVETLKRSGERESREGQVEGSNMGATACCNLNTPSASSFIQDRM